MELSTFCEICVNKDECGVNNPTCRNCATNWRGKGIPRNYCIDQRTIAAAMNKQASSEQTLAKFTGMGISTYQTYTRESLSVRRKLLNDIISFAETELNRISKDEGSL